MNETNLINFWDTSGIIPLLVQEKASSILKDYYDNSENDFIWILTPVEVLSALYRRKRMNDLDEEAVAISVRRFRQMKNSLTDVQNIEEVLLKAQRNIKIHELRAADSLQLAAAMFSCLHRPEGQKFVCLDNRLRKAALDEGFTLFPEDPIG